MRTGVRSCILRSDERANRRGRPCDPGLGWHCPAPSYSSPPSAGADHYEVFLVAGQSNGDGRGRANYGHWTEGEPPYIVSVRLTLTELDRLGKDRK